jgi:hypothetical protein
LKVSGHLAAWLQAGANICKRKNALITRRSGLANLSQNELIRFVANSGACHKHCCACFGYCSIRRLQASLRSRIRRIKRDWRRKLG